MDFVLDAAGAGRVDARLERAGLLDLTMEEAGRAVADEVQTACPQGAVLVVAGGGANGGDALVAARHLRALGRDVTVLAAPARHPLTRLNRRRWVAVGGEVRRLDGPAIRRRLGAAEVLLDGLLGTGFRPPLRPAFEAVVKAILDARAAGLKVVSIDVPSGLDSSVAVPSTPSVQADRTVTLMGWKSALLFGAAAAQAGTVILAPLRVPSEWVATEALATRPFDAELGAWLPVRRADAHKGTAGRVWIIGGHPGTVGAPVLAGAGALRGGAGLVTLHSLAALPLLTAELMSQMYRDWPEAFRAWGDTRPDALAVGMGLGPDAADVARHVLAWRVPTVVDADALQPALAGAGHPEVIWTPHPGEAARLLECDTAFVTRDPLAAAAALQRLLGGVVVLKGGPTVIAGAGGLSVSRGGHPGMGKAGMGDTLGGVLAALLGQGLDAERAAAVGVRLHARAGEFAAQRHGYGLTASDLAGELGAAWADLRRHAGLPVP